MTNPKTQITLFQPPPAFGVPNPSPFCLKLETWLKMAEFPYRFELCRDPSKGPKGLIPFVRIGAETMGDSDLIIDRLEADAPRNPNSGLDAVQRATGRAICDALDERFYWTLLYSRFIDERCWPSVKDAFFARFAAPLRPILAAVVQRGQRRRMEAQGIARHTEAEIYGIAEKSINALAALLGDKPYFLDDRPRRVDAACYAYLANAYHCELDMPQKAMVEAHPNLADYTDRMRDRYFGDRAEDQAALKAVA